MNLPIPTAIEKFLSLDSTLSFILGIIFTCVSNNKGPHNYKKIVKEKKNGYEREIKTAIREDSPQARSDNLEQND